MGRALAPRLSLRAHDRRCVCHTIACRYPAQFRELLSAMLALEPSARPAPADAQACLQTIISDANRAAASQTPAAGSADGGDDGHGDELEVQVRSVSGGSSVVRVPRDATVAYLKAAAASQLEASKANGDFTFLLLSAGHKLDDHVAVQSLMADRGTVFHLVALSATGACLCAAECVEVVQGGGRGCARHNLVNYGRALHPWPSQMPARAHTAPMRTTSAARVCCPRGAVCGRVPAHGTDSHPLSCCPRRSRVCLWSSQALACASRAPICLLRPTASAFPL